MDKPLKVKPKSKTEIVQMVVEASGLDKKQVVAVLEALASTVKTELTSGPGVVVLPDLVKFKVVRKPATAERKGISPITKQEIVFKAKPARSAVKAAPVKSLKDAVA